MRPLTVLTAAALLTASSTATAGTKAKAGHTGQWIITWKSCEVTENPTPTPSTLLQGMLCNPPSQTSTGAVTVSDSATQISLSKEFVPQELTWSTTDEVYEGSQTVDAITVHSVVTFDTSTTGLIVDLIEMKIAGDAIKFTTKYTVRIE
jgi:hypothetical protein